MNFYIRGIISRSDVKDSDNQEAIEVAALKMTYTVKYDWYQTDSAVTVAVLLKNAADKNYSVTLQEREVLLKADGIEPLAINLGDAINVAESSHRATPSKVEIKLAKLTGDRCWPTLEKQEAGGSGGARPKKHNWDKMATEVETEEAEEADGAGNAFRKIFARASDVAKKAVMKSYDESEGNDLSLDWEDVGSETVEVNPPEDCVVKKGLRLYAQYFCSWKALFLQVFIFIFANFIFERVFKEYELIE